jgi:hypothetical protein
MNDEWGKYVGWRNEHATEHATEHHVVEYSEDHPSSEAQIMSK